MPELPEVETIKRQLIPRLVNKKIHNVKVFWPNIIANKTKEEFINELSNQVFMDVTRKGKWLIFELTTDYLIVHLRMEGKFFLKSHNEEVNKHEHIIFDLGDIELRYQDTRKFGKMYLIKKEYLYTSKPISELGLEPFDSNLNVSYLKDKYIKKRLSIKEVLLDQSIVTGIGNIYANEILFLSKINPKRRSNELKNIEIERIINNTKDVLLKAIDLGGTTIRSYASLNNEHGLFQSELKVHQREGQKCPICGTEIIKEKVGGRGTYYCPTCQK